MGGGGSKGGGLKDDAPPPPPPPMKVEKPGAKEKGKDEVGLARKRIAVSEKKTLNDQHTKVDEDLSDSSEEGGAYDSDLERNITSDAEVLGKQEAEDEHKRLALQDRARQDALPWTTLCLPPRDYTPADNAEYKPEETVSLEFVHGYRGWDCQGNVLYSVTEEVLYFAGSVGIVLDPNTCRQKHYLGPPAKQGRMKEITAVAMHPSGAIAAVGERSLQVSVYIFDLSTMASASAYVSIRQHKAYVSASIYIFDLSTMATLREIPLAHEGGVTALSFSKDGKRLVSAGMSVKERTVSVWEWKNDKKDTPLCSTVLRSPKILAIGYNPRDDVMVACGINMIEFLRVGLSRTGQRVLEHLAGVFSVSNRATHNVSPTMICVAFTKTEFSVVNTVQNSVEGLCLTGSDLGNIYLWKREEQIDMIVSAHKSSVYALATFINGFVSGGKDGKVRVWNNDLEGMRSYDISAATLNEVVIKAIDQRQGRVIIGTSSSTLYELDQDSGSVRMLVTSHKEGGIYCVATHPTKPLYASVGDDAILRFWDLASHVQWKTKPLEGPGHSIAFSPDGKVVAVGHNLGSWSVHRIDNLDEVISSKDRKKAILALRYSPNGRYLAVASEDSMIDIYDCVSDYDFLGALQGHPGSVMALDWSLDSTLIQSCGSEQDLLFWNVETQELLNGFDDTRDTDWETYTCTLGWSVQGIVGSGIVNKAACRSLSCHLLATCNTDSLVRVFRYPCVVTGAEENLSGGHTGSVSSVRFTFDDTYLVSCGLHDRCVMQWRVSSEADTGFDGLDSNALKHLEEVDLGSSKQKDLFEQSRVDKRNSRLEAEKVPLMDPGKPMPEKEGKQRGKEAQRGETKEVPSPNDPKKKKENLPAPEQPGVPEALPEMDDEIMEEFNIEDSDIEREKDLHGQRGSYFRGAVPPVRQDIASEIAGMPVPGKPLFELRSQAMAVPPVKYKKPDDADDAPMGGLQMEFIYGLRMQDSRQCAQYTGHGHVVFLAGATAVVYSPVQHTQKFFNGHTEDVIALALHPDLVTAATGQVGRKALLCVWDTYTMQTFSVIRGFHDHGICSLGFSGDGTRLLSVGIDIDHSIAVWSWQSGHKVASAVASVGRIFACAFNPVNEQVVTVGLAHVKFWSINGRLLRGRSGSFTQGSKQQAFVSLAISKKGRIYVGSEQGEIYRWKDQEVDSLVVAHEGPVFALWVCRDGVVSGGKDGLVKVWSLALKTLVEFDMRTQSTGLDRTHIRTVCWLTRTILVGTHDSELFEIDIEAGTPNLLLQGHRAGKISGLHAHPSKRIFVTGADDQTVRLWDMDVRKQVNMRTLDGPVKSVCISLDGSHIACGLEDGRLIVLKLKTMRQHLERRDRKEAINEVRYSANGKLLAAAGSDAKILIYDVLSEYEWIGTCTGHTAPVVGLDWSDDSKLLQSDDNKGSHLYWDIESCKELLVAAEIRDVQWVTWTCIMGWPVQGICPKFQGPLGINTTCRSSFGDTLATADDWGMVKLFRFPCITSGARCKRYGGHSARVSKVRFSFEEKTVLSCGLIDGLIIQWRYLSSGKLMDLQEVLSDDEDEMEAETAAGAQTEEKEDSDVEKELTTHFGRGESLTTVDKTGIMQVRSQRMITGKEKVSKETRGMEHKEGDSHIDLSSLAETAAAGKGPGGTGGSDWRKPMDADEAPYNNLQLEHVYGYRGHDCRNNLLYTAEGHVVYMVAAVAVVYKKDAHAQMFYSMHTDDIITIAQHPDKLIMATGQVGKMPLIHVWHSGTMQTLATLRGFHEMGIAALGFNKDGAKLASVGLDRDHSMAIWDWRKGVRIATCPAHTDKIFEARFNPVDDVLVTCGVHHVKFWTMVGDNQLKSKKAVYGQDGVSHTMLCCAFTDAGLVLTGGLNGDVFLWKGSHLEWQFENAHTGPVFALATYPDGFVSGGKDGRVRLWSGLDPVKIFDFSGTCVASTIATRIRSACWRDGHVLVGTMSNEIFEVDERTMTQRLIVQSHAGAEVWGLDTHPTQPAFATGGEDATVRVYKVSSRKASMVRELPRGVKAVAYNKDGTFLAAGLVDGMVVILETKKLAVVCERRTRETCITDLKFSPDGRLLATTSADGSLDVYDSQSDFELTGTAKTVEGAALTHLDWSADGFFIQTDNSLKAHQYWDAGSLVEQVGADEALSRATWHTWTCTYGWSVQGLAPKMAQVTGVNSVARSSGGSVLAVALDFGVIALYRFPCPYVGTKHKRFAGHSAGVSKVCFTKDDKYMISIGALDRCIMQWEHIAD